MKNTTANHLARLACYLTQAQPATPPREWADLVCELHRLGKALHARYEAACNYEWANTPAYEKRTANLEQKIIRLAKAAGIKYVDSYHDLLNGSESRPRDGVYISLNTDPRGWPIVLSIKGSVDRLGGEV